MLAQATVFIVEDDDDVREAMLLTVRSIGLNALSYTSAEEFLEQFSHAFDAPMCLVLDIRLQGMSGLALQEELMARKIDIPIIIVTAFAKVSLVVQAMKTGAAEFIEKPFYHEALVTVIERCIDRHSQALWKRGCGSRWSNRIDLLSPRERQVLDLCLAAKGTKQIAVELGIDPKTVAKHRAHVLEKLQVESLMEIRESAIPSKKEAERNSHLQLRADAGR